MHSCHSLVDVFRRFSKQSSVDVIGRHSCSYKNPDSNSIIASFFFYRGVLNNPCFIQYKLCIIKQFEGRCVPERGRVKEGTRAHAYAKRATWGCDKKKCQSTIDKRLIPFGIMAAYYHQTNHYNHKQNKPISQAPNLYYIVSIAIYLSTNNDL